MYLAKYFSVWVYHALVLILLITTNFINGICWSIPFPSFSHFWFFVHSLTAQRFFFPSLSSWWTPLCQPFCQIQPLNKKLYKKEWKLLGCCPSNHRSGFLIWNKLCIDEKGHLGIFFSRKHEMKVFSFSLVFTGLEWQKNEKGTQQCFFYLILINILWLSSFFTSSSVIYFWLHSPVFHSRKGKTNSICK